jgi:hypothetical protein
MPTRSDDYTVPFEWADYQRACVDDLESGDYDVVVLRIGYGGGKSYAGAQWIHEGSLQLSGGESLVLAPDYQKGGPATYRVFFETLPGPNTVPNDAAGDPENSPIVAGYNQNEKRVTYVSGHVVRLGSADKWNRYAGSEFHRIWMDEPAHYDNTNLYDLHEMLVSRQRTHAGPNTTFMTSTGAGFGQFYDLTERRIEPDGEGGERTLSWDDALKVHVTSSLRNPFLPTAAKEKLRRQFEGTSREEQALHGGFAAPTGLVYPDFSRDRHVREHDALAERVDGHREYGYDHGWDDPRVVLEAGYTEYGQLAILDEFYKSGVEYDRAVAWLTENDKPDGTVHAEHEPEHQHAFRRAGYRVEPANKDLDEGIPAVRDRLDWRDDPQGRPGLLISDECVETIRELMDYQEEEVGTARATDHAADSLRYLVMGVDGETKTAGGVTDVF